MEETYEKVIGSNVNFDLMRHMLEKNYKDEFIEGQRDCINMYTDAPERPDSKIDKPSDILNYASSNSKIEYQTAGGGGDGNNGSGSGGTGGGGGDGGSSEGEGQSNRRMTADQKYAAKGIISKECLLFALP